MFTHLHVKSAYSYGVGASTIEDLVDAACARGYSSLALTDRNTMVGAVEFYNRCVERNVHAVIGAEIDDASGVRAVLLCRNVTGYHRLCEIISLRQLRERFDLAATLAEDRVGIWALSDSLSLLRHPALRNDIHGELVLAPERRRSNREVFRHCESSGIPMVITNDVCFAALEDYERHRVLAAIRSLQTVDDPQVPTVSAEQYLKSPADMERAARGLRGAMARTTEIAQHCQFAFELKKYHCARYPSGEPSDAALHRIAMEGMVRRYERRWPSLTLRAQGKVLQVPHPEMERVRERIEYELEVIRNLNFADYFLICWDVVQFARRQGIWHVGRGSAANSLVSYCLELTEVDPIRYQLYFERFLNYARGSPPDIDLDFSWRHRDTILRYIYERYGHTRVAMMSSIHTLHARGALHEVAKAHGIGDRELAALRKYIPHVEARYLQDLRAFPETKHLDMDNHLIRRVMQIAAEMEGYPQYSGIHASGVVITEKPVTYFSALERSANGFIKTQLDMYSGEDVGLIKIDILAVRGLGVIEDAVRAVERDTGRAPPIKEWDTLFSDEPARALLRSGESIGVVHAESPFIRNAMRIVGADTFELVYIISGMVRTGCVESGMMYLFIERQLNPEKRKEALPALMEILPETYGVMIFEEDVIKVLHFVGGLTLEEADTVRRCMSGKRVPEERMRMLRAKFFRACLARVGDAVVVDALWRQIESFSGFSYCKAHSASYALMSFQAAYLKAHYPAHYMAAVLSNEGGFYTPAAYVSECRRLGLRLLPPDINRSDVDYRAEGRDAIRIGLRFIGGLPLATAEAIVRERERGLFQSLTDFVARTAIDPEEAIRLIRIGCFDDTGKKRTVLVMLLDTLMQIKKQRLALDLFQIDLSYFEKSIGHVDDMTEEEKLCVESEYLGYLIHHHPLEYFPRQTEHPQIVKAADLHRYPNRTVKMIGWLVSSKRIRTRDKKDATGKIIRAGEYMKFMTLEDLTGVYDIVLFPSVYKEVAAETLSPGPYCIEGRVDPQYHTINVTRLARIRPMTATTEVHLKMLIEKQETYPKADPGYDGYPEREEATPMRAYG